jgi:hypothetical protein
MAPRNPDRSNHLLRDIRLDDEHAHLLMEYDERATPLAHLMGTIEAAATRVVDVVLLREAPADTKAVLVTLDTRDIRSVILSLAKYPLINIEGYDSKVGE